MAIDFKKLRESSSIETTKKLLEEKEKPSFGDSRIWKIGVDKKTGNGEAVIRFLPANPLKEEETSPFVDKYVHYFKGKSGRYYNENCPTSISGECPVCDANREVFNAYKDNQEQAKRITKGKYRNHKYFSNILVIEDKANPDNEGKVFLFEYGPKIYEMIQEAIKPTSSRKKAISPFSIFEDGANFIIVAKTVNEQRNYDSSEFEAPSKLDMTDEELEKLFESCYSLQAIVSVDNFKNYEELERILAKVEIVKHSTYEPEEPTEDHENSGVDKDISIEDLNDDLPF